MNPRSWRPKRGTAILLVALFAGAVAISWWLTPIVPFATVEGMAHAFSPDAKVLLLLSGKDGEFVYTKLRVWDIGSGQERLAAEGMWHENLESAAFSPDGKWLAAVHNGQLIKIWDTAQGGEFATIRLQTWTDIRFSPDSRFLVYGSRNVASLEKRLHLWSIALKREFMRIDRGTNFKFTTDGRMFAAAVADELQLWNIEKTPVMVTKHFAKEVVHISPNATRFVTRIHIPEKNQWHTTLRDMMTGEMLWFWPSNQRWYLESIQGNDNPTVLARNESGQFVILEAGVPTELEEFGRHIANLAPAGISPNREWIFAATAHGARLRKRVEIREGMELAVDGDWTYAGYFSDSALPPLFSPDCTLVVVAELRLAERKSWLPKWVPAALNPFPGDSGRKIVRAWNVEDGTLAHTFLDCETAVFSPNGACLTTTGSGGTSLWHLPLPALPLADPWMGARWLVRSGTRGMAWDRHQANSPETPTRLTRGFHMRTMVIPGRRTSGVSS